MVRRKPHSRSASIIIEVVISAALLATGLIALSKLAQSSAQLTEQADQRLAATLAAENVIARVGPDMPALKPSIQKAAKEVEARSGCKITCVTEPFVLGEREGVHLRVTAEYSQRIRVQLHRWYLKSEDAENSDSESEVDGDE